MEFLNSQTELFNESKSNIQIKNNLKALTNIENNDMSYSIDLSTKIGSGAFGDIYKVTCTTTNVVSAVKIETVQEPAMESVPSLILGTDGQPIMI